MSAPPEDAETVLSLPAEFVPDDLRTWLMGLGDRAMVASLELLEDGRLVIQVLPDLDPRFVARVRRTMAQYDDVLKRLTYDNARESVESDVP